MSEGYDSSELRYLILDSTRFAVHNSHFYQQLISVPEVKLSS